MNSCLEATPSVAHANAALSRAGAGGLTSLARHGGGRLHHEPVSCSDESEPAVLTPAAAITARPVPVHPPRLSPQGLCREYVTWDSHVLGRRMELLVFGHGGARVLVFPTRRGRFYEYEDGGLIEALRPRIEEGWIQLFCVDGIDAESVYNRDISPEERIRRHVQYENYIVHGVIPYTEARNRNPVLVAHGASLGAWHAMNIALRHPHLFHRAVCLSGRYDLTSSMPPDFEDLFDGYYNQTIYYNTPLHFLPRMSDPVLMEQLRRLHITLVIGEQDPFVENNRDMSHVLTGAGVPHDLHFWTGRAHRFARWKEMVPLFL